MYAENLDSDKLIRYPIILNGESDGIINEIRIFTEDNEVGRWKIIQ